MENERLSDRLTSMKTNAADGLQTLSNGEEKISQRLQSPIKTHG